jgi:hypothetical protein
MLFDLIVLETMVYNSIQAAFLFTSNEIVEKMNLLLKEKMFRVMLYAEGFARKLHGQGKQILKLLEE